MAWQRAAFDILDHGRPSPLSWAHCASLSAAILQRGEVGDDRWAALLRSFDQAPTNRLLLFVLGAVELAPGHRRSLTQAIGERRVAAIVDNVVGRGMITALSWSGVPVESFPLSRIRDALAALDPESEGDSVDQCLDFAARLIEGSDLSAQLRDKLVGAAGYRAALAR